jgi:hypothetical protein
MAWQGPSGTTSKYLNISLGRTDALLFWSLSGLFNTGYREKCPFFARILARCRARGITIPTIGLGSLHSIAPKPIVGIVVPRARHSAKIRAKSLIVSEKKPIQIIAHLCSEMAVFGRKSVLFLPSGTMYRFDTQGWKHAVQFYLRNRTTAHTEYLNGLYC